MDKECAVAVVGMGLKGPGDATSPESFFEMLKQGRSARTEIPKTRFNINAFYHPDQDRCGAMNLRHANFIKEDITAFDAPFFSISAAEAAYMDPQQRGILECVYHALENAGIPLSSSLGTNTAVFIGNSARDFDSVVCKDPELDIKYASTGMSLAMLSNRVSWFYDFRGPSMTLDTACSSSLVACHLACNSLRSGECSMALLGGTNIIMVPEMWMPMTNLGFSGPDGKCYSFDEKANGYARGEGIGALVLKRLDDAIRDGDTVRAVIRSTYTNQDGRTPGITQPSKEAQIAAIRHAYDIANLSVTNTRFFEAHGTGTQVGDTTEAAAIAEVFSDSRTAESPLYVGALKTNIGHLEGAAGIFSIIKVVLSLEHGIIPPNLWLEKVNPSIKAATRNLEFPSVAKPWPSGLRRASINGFGFGGSNAHVIIDDALHYLRRHGVHAKHQTVENPESMTIDKSASIPESSRQGAATVEAPMLSLSESGITEVTNEISGKCFANELDTMEKLPASRKLFVWSASDEAGLQRLTKLYAAYTVDTPSAKNEETFLNDLSFTLACRRSAFPWRISIIANTVSEVRSKLDMNPQAIRAHPDPAPAFIFTGQGAQWYAMGRELISYPVFAKSIHAASVYLHTLGCPWDLIDEYLKPEEASSIQNPAISQPLCTVLQVALVDLLRSWNVRPYAVVGHSSGEIAAAYTAGAISCHSAWKIAYLRGTLSEALAKASRSFPAGMLAVGLSPDEARLFIGRVNCDGGEGITIACLNSPRSVTLSGRVSNLAKLKSLLDHEGIFSRMLKVENAYHSSLMSPIAEDYEEQIGSIKQAEDQPQQSNCRYYSSLTGRCEDHSKLTTSRYWVANLLSPVLFDKAVTKLLADARSKENHLSISDIIEVGPHSALRGPLQEIIKTQCPTNPPSYLSLLIRGECAVETMLAIMGWLHCRGHPVTIERINANAGRQRSPSLLTDLPSYPFNHEKGYWAESRLSRNWRFRKQPRHELLGAPVPDWDEQNAVWRNWLKVSENPWIIDHQVTGTVLYPAAGMIVMAIEAMLRLTSINTTMRAIKLKDISFHTALQVPQTSQGIETHLHLRPHRYSTTSASSSWTEFELRSCTEDVWTEHCRGLIRIDEGKVHSNIEGDREERYFHDLCCRDLAHAEEICCTRVPRKELYRSLENLGMQFGPIFQRLSDIKRGSDGRCVATVSAADIADKMPHGFLHSHLIHPSTLDGVLHSILATNNDIRAVVPSRIRELWIAAGNGTTHDLHRLHANLKARIGRDQEADIISIDPHSSRPLIVARQLTMVTVAENMPKDFEATHPHLCFNIEWKPEPSLVSKTDTLTTFMPPKSIDCTCPMQRMKDLDTLAVMYLIRYMKTDPASRLSTMSLHHRKFVLWIVHHLKRYDSGELSLPDPKCREMAEDDDCFRALEAKLDRSCPEATLAIAMASSIDQIVQGTKDPLQVLFQEGKADEFYRSGIGADIVYAKLCSYLDALTHKEPTLKILELGAGTGGATKWIMKTLTMHGAEGGTPRFHSYTFTDVSASFFEKAKEAFRDYNDRVSYRVLDIEIEPAEQGFQHESFDVVIAANVLHATRSIDMTLQNVRKLLKPQGKLILYEITNFDATAISFFGLLPGWWLSVEPHRAWSPLMSVSSWQKHLKANGFSGVDTCFEDFPGATWQATSGMIATSMPESIAVPKSVDVVIVVSSNTQFRLAQRLRQLLMRNRISAPEIEALESIEQCQLSNKCCIVLSGLHSAILTHLTEIQLKQLKIMSSSASGILWVTRGDSRSGSDPLAEMAAGFSRSMRTENPGLQFVTLSTGTTKDDDLVLTHISQLFCVVFQGTDAAVVDNTFTIIDNIIHIPRLVEANYMNKAIKSKTSQGLPRSEYLEHNPDLAIKLTVGTLGLLETLHFEHDSLQKRPLKGNEVEIRVEASGLNFRNVLGALGHINLPITGVEGAGVITRIGPTSNFEPGVRVFGMIDGGFNTFARASDDTIARIPDDVDFVTAAGIPIAYVTAYCALYDIGSLHKNNTVLIHSATGGVGQACIQLAKHRGAEIFATVGTLDKREFLQRQYDIQEDHIFSSRDLTFAQGLMRMTNGRGVDVIVNSLSGEGLRESWNCIAANGRFVEIGKADIYSNARLSMEKFRYNVRFQCLDVAFMGVSEPLRFRQALETVVRLFTAGVIKTVDPIQKFTLGQISMAFQLMQSGKHIGKIVVEHRKNDQILIRTSNHMKSTFEHDAAYVISGGTGGIGRSIARWMVDHGARNLILLSRSGTTRNEAKSLVTELEAQGARIYAPACDVSDSGTLCQIIENAAQTMPPIRGCIQASMVLKDSLFLNMSIEEFHAVLKPKVQASWNLHKHLPNNLDFFVLLSSGAGIVGRGGQTNYNIGNTYQDALARYRVSKGQKAVAIDLGLVLSVGYAAETLDDLQSMRNAGCSELREDQLHAMLDELCDASLPLPTLLQSQICLGHELPEVLKARGIDEPWWVRDPIFKHLYNIRTTSSEGQAHKGDVSLNHVAMLKNATSTEAAEAIVIQATREKIAKVLSVKVEDVEAAVPLTAYGVDSLVAVELRTWFFKELGAEVAVFDIMSDSTIEALSVKVVAKSALVDLNNGEDK